MSPQLPLVPSRRPPRLPRLAAIAIPAGSIALLAAPSSADAQSFVERFAIRGEVGGGTMLSQYQRNTLNFGPDVQGSGRLAFSIFRPLAVQASFTSWFFPSSSGSGQELAVMGGLRLEPMLGSVGRIFVDYNVGVGYTAGNQQRLAMDAGAGFEFALSRAIGLGPVVRYGRLFASGNPQDYPSDAQFWSVGLSLALRVPERHPRATDAVAVDTDSDGVFDVQDECPHAPAGSNPDPLHPGCPTRDRDHDGVSDARDMCPSVPQGEHTDPSRPGCPATDEDHDGVFDPTDLCATTPQGPNPDPNRVGCPDGDDDADGVPNHADMCRTEPQGLHPDPARPGCPIADRDHDTVPDRADACPDVAGSPSTDRRRNGCPGLVLVRNGMIVILQPVFFATDGARILRPSFPGLAAVASALQAQPEILRIGVEGHTDDVGTASDNMILSQRRADASAAWLERHGVAASRVEARGYGMSMPIVPNGSASGRAANRRVEFHILDPRPSNNSVDARGSASVSTAANLH